MKKILSLILLSLMLASCNAKLTEDVQSTFDNGQPKYVKLLNRKGKCVKEVEYYEDGVVKMEGAIRDGHREGNWKAFFPDGKPQSIGGFKEGLRDGFSVVYYETGTKMMEGNYSVGQHVGVWKYYDEAGNMLKEVDYGNPSKQ